MNWYNTLKEDNEMKLFVSEVRKAHTQFSRVLTEEMNKLSQENDKMFSAEIKEMSANVLDMMAIFTKLYEAIERQEELQ